jgi:hypothetical protein
MLEIDPDSRKRRVLRRDVLEIAKNNRHLADKGGARTITRTLDSPASILNRTFCEDIGAQELEN